MSTQSKYEHRDNLVEIGCQAVEHALRFLPQDSPTRLLVEQRLTVLRNRDTKTVAQMVRSIRRETEYSMESCIRRASAELLKLQTEKWLSGNALTSRIFVPCWDAGSFIGRGEEAEIESKWQDECLYPQIEKLFDKA